MIMWSVSAGDIVGTLQQHQIKDGDVLVVKINQDTNEPVITQEDVDKVLEIFLRAMSASGVNARVIVVPLPTGIDVDVNTLTEEEKENLREIMRRIGVI